MIKKTFLTLPLCLGVLIFGKDINHDLTDCIKELVTEYVSYSYDYDVAYKVMCGEVISSKTSFVAPLVPALIVAAISFHNPPLFQNPPFFQNLPFFEDPNLLEHFVESILFGFITYSCTFFAQLLVLLPLASIQRVRRCLAPQGSKILEYYEEKKEQIINKLKNYIAENTILPEDLDHIIHRAFLYESPGHNRYYHREHAIIMDMLNKIHN